MDDLKCKGCGGENFTFKEKGPHTGAYCCECGKFVKWVSADEKKEIERMESSKETASSERELSEDETALMLKALLGAVNAVTETLKIVVAVQGKLFELLCEKNIVSEEELAKVLDEKSIHAAIAQMEKDQVFGA